MWYAPTTCDCCPVLCINTVRLFLRKTSIHFSLITSFSTIHMHKHTLCLCPTITLGQCWIWCYFVFSLNLGAHYTIVGFYVSHRYFLIQNVHYLHITQHIKRIYYSFPVCNVRVWCLWTKIRQFFLLKINFHSLNCAFELIRPTLCVLIRFFFLYR